MPLYEYQCDSCGHRFEQIRKFSDPLLTACPKCDGTVRKLPSSPAIQFKGTGWYVTDYAKKGAAGGTAPETEAPGGKGSKEEKKTDKPDTKSGDAGTPTGSSKTAKESSAGDAASPSSKT